MNTLLATLLVATTVAHAPNHHDEQIKYALNTVENGQRYNYLFTGHMIEETRQYMVYKMDMQACIKRSLRYDQILSESLFDNWIENNDYHSNFSFKRNIFNNTCVLTVRKHSFSFSTDRRNNNFHYSHYNNYNNYYHHGHNHNQTRVVIRPNNNRTRVIVRPNNNKTRIVVRANNNNRTRVVVRNNNDRTRVVVRPRSNSRVIVRDRGNNGTRVIVKPRTFKKHKKNVANFHKKNKKHKKGNVKIKKYNKMYY